MCYIIARVIESVQPIFIGIFHGLVFIDKYL
jgi:hypothetical protein